METWQEVLKKNSIASLEALAARSSVPSTFPSSTVCARQPRTSSSGSRRLWSS